MRPKPALPGGARQHGARVEVELLAVEAEGELWELDFGAKMALADERRGRGNELFRGGWYEWAASEYEQAMRYLVFMAHPTDDEAPKIAEATATVQLNLAAAALRCGREDDAVRHAEKVLALRPDDAKALYRLGQAYTNLNRCADAADALRRAAAASADDAAAVARVKQEKRMRERRARGTASSAARTRGWSAAAAAATIRRRRRVRRRGRPPLAVAQRGAPRFAQHAHGGAGGVCGRRLCLFGSGWAHRRAVEPEAIFRVVFCAI